MKVHVFRDGETLSELDLAAGEYLIGSGASAHLRLPGDSVAPEHARLTIGAGGVEVEDLGSGRGTYLGELALTGAQPVPDGSILQFGDIALQIWDSESAVEAAPEPREESRYVIGEIVAEGAMGVIRRARELSTGRDVAMKQMREEVADGSEVGAARFVQEAKITAHLEHPNVVPVHDVGHGAGGPSFYTMKMVRGISLEKVLELLTRHTDTALKKYPLEALLTIFQKVCDALAFAHSKGIIHRDLKPANLMVGEYGEVLVMDWGLAKLVGEAAEELPAADPETNTGAGSSSVTLAGTIMGTPYYMAPEQAAGDIALVDERSDIYSLGAILYELLTLQTSVEGRGFKEVLQKVRDGKITPILQRAGKIPLPHLPGGRIPASLAAVVTKAMAYSPERRYQKVTDLQAEIRAFQSGFATGAEGAGAWRQFTLLVKRNKGVATAIAASVVLLGLLTAIYIGAVRRERDKATTALAQVSLEKKRAENALGDLRATAPIMVNEGRRLIDQQKLAEALAKLDLAVSLDPSNPDFHLLRAHLLQAMERLKEAASAYRQVSIIRPTQSVSDNLALCEKLLQDNLDREELSQTSREELLQAMLKEGRAIFAVPLSSQISQPAALVTQLKSHWNQGQELDAVNDFRALKKLSIDSAIRTAALSAFGEARWKAIWFPSRYSPLGALKEWRACVELPEAVVTEVSALNFQFPSAGPRGLNLNPDLNQRGPGPKEFGMIATTQRVFPAGKWRFTVRSDDGARLFVNGTLLIDNWHYSSATEKFADFVQQTTTSVDLRVEYCQKDQGATLQLFVEPVTD